MICKKCGRQLQNSNIDKCPHCGSQTGFAATGNGFYDILAKNATAAAPASTAGDSAMAKDTNAAARRAVSQSARNEGLIKLGLIASAASLILLIVILVVTLTSGSSTPKTEVPVLNPGDEVTDNDNIDKADDSEENAEIETKTEKKIAFANISFDKTIEPAKADEGKTLAAYAEIAYSDGEETKTVAVTDIAFDLTADEEAVILNLTADEEAKLGGGALTIYVFEKTEKTLTTGAAEQKKAYDGFVETSYRAVATSDALNFNENGKIIVVGDENDLDFEATLVSTVKAEEEEAEKAVLDVTFTKAPENAKYTVNIKMGENGENEVLSETEITPVADPEENEKLISTYEHKNIDVANIKAKDKVEVTISAEVEDDATVTRYEKTVETEYTVTVAEESTDNNADETTQTETTQTETTQTETTQTETTQPATKQQ